LVYLAVTNTVTLIHLLPSSEREKAIKILVLRHRLSVLQRQAAKHAFTHDDRFLHAGLLHHPQLENRATSSSSSWSWSWSWSCGCR
jgi:hypothetical protein